MRYIGLVTVDLDVENDDEADRCMKKLVNIMEEGVKRESITCRPLLTKFSCQADVLSAESEPLPDDPDDDPEALFEEEK